MQTPKIERITISLPHDMLSSIKEKVQAGEYASTSEIIRDAMRQWQKNEQDRSAVLHVIKDRLKQSLRSGSPVPIEKAFGKIRAHHRKIVAKQK